MKLREYLKRRGETQTEFSERCAVPQRTIAHICSGRISTSVQTAKRIIDASREKPAPDGATVTLDDLIPDRTTAA